MIQMVQEEDRFKSEKEAITRLAVDHIHDGDTVMLDAGSTTLQIARPLKQKRSIKIATNAVNIAWELSSSDVEVTSTGGMLRRNTLVLVRPIAGNTLAGLLVDNLFLAPKGVDLKWGLTSSNLTEVQSKRAMLDSAQEVILVTVHSKFRRIAFTQVCGLDRVHWVITDAGVPPDSLHSLRKLRLRVLVPEN